MEQVNIRGFGPYLVRRELEDWIRTLAATDDVSQERKYRQVGVLRNGYSVRQRCHVCL